MRIIPVIDLLGGRAVRGRSGDRARYLPVRSRLGGRVERDLSEPGVLLDAYRAALHPDTLYVADLDRIAGAGDNDAIVRRLAGAAPGLRVLWDGGLAGAAGGGARCPGDGIVPVLGTETLQSIAALRRGSRHDTRRPVLSLDLLGGARVIARSAAIARLDPLDLLSAARDRGVRTAILLVLDRVGTGAGAPLDRLRRLRRGLPDLELLVGGGIASIDELRRLRAEGFDGALLATALHERRVTPSALARAGFLARLQTSSRVETGRRGTT